MTPRLSICIATLNRARFLEETLHSILDQATDEVEVVIVDGASSDGTEEVVRGLQQGFPCIRYIRREKAMGVDRDFDAAVQHAGGDYCWLLCDDDLLKPGAVAKVLSETRREHSLLVVNADVWNAGYSKLLQGRRMKIDGDRAYSPSSNEALFAGTAEYLTFIGGVVIRRDLWMARERERFFGTEFIHVGVIFQAPLPGTALVISNPLISIRYGMAQWTARSFDIWMFKWPELVWSLPDISDAAKHRVTPREPWKILKTLLTFRAMGAYSLKTYHDKVRRRTTGRSQRALPFLVSILPGRILNLLGVAYFFCFHRQALMPIVDLRNSRFCFFPRSKDGKDFNKG
ncbi:MAG: glycosyltransferase family 2 protein [Deltaproteobacteria bacterium]|nr:glycosyltransferase family 2 protein [Deltaproteobacteria bacterium]